MHMCDGELAYGTLRMTSAVTSSIICLYGTLQCALEIKYYNNQLTNLVNIDTRVLHFTTTEPHICMYRCH